jgi:C1A family cysteine protease
VVVSRSGLKISSALGLNCLIIRVANIGPVACQIRVYKDFMEWKPENGVYRQNASSEYRGGHGLLIVGYDDERQCWILKNSWGTDFGDKGYIYVG